MQREAAFHNAVGLLGGLDIMVNAAGIQRRYPCEEFPQEEWDRVLEVNLTRSNQKCPALHTLLTFSLAAPAQDGPQPLCQIPRSACTASCRRKRSILLGAANFCR